MTTKMTAAEPLTAEQEASLIQAAQAGDQDAATLVLRSQIRRITSMARKRVRDNVLLDDVLAAGVEEFLKGLYEHDTSRGRYLWFDRVGRAMTEEMSAHFSPVRVPTYMLHLYRKAVAKTDSDTEARDYATSPERGAKRMDPLTFDAIHRLAKTTGLEAVEAQPNHRPGVRRPPVQVNDDFTVNVEARDEATRLMAVLTERERQVIEMSMGFGGEPMTDGAIAKVLGIDRTRVVRIRQAALARMREVAQ